MSAKRSGADVGVVIVLGLIVAICGAVALWLAPVLGIGPAIGLVALIAWGVGR